MPFTLKGVATMANKIRAISSKFPDDVASALYYEANIEMTEAKRRCPRSPGGGTLRASGFVADPERKGRNIIVVLGFGGAASDYAEAVHEHLSEHSPPSWQGKEELDWTIPGTGPKFLEGPLKESAPYMGKRIAARINLRNIA